jgi:hypothetical protein
MEEKKLRPTTAEEEMQLAVNLSTLTARLGTYVRKAVKDYEKGNVQAATQDLMAYQTTLKSVEIYMQEISRRLQKRAKLLGKKKEIIS